MKTLVLVLSILGLAMGPAVAGAKVMPEWFYNLGSDESGNGENDTNANNSSHSEDSEAAE